MIDILTSKICCSNLDRKYPTECRWIHFLESDHLEDRRRWEDDIKMGLVLEGEMSRVGLGYLLLWYSYWRRFIIQHLIQELDIKDPCFPLL